MEIKTIKSTSLDTLIQLYDMHSGFFQNVIDGISEKDAQNRLNTKANHVAWIAGSIVNQRYEIARVSGVEIRNDFHDFFKDFQGIKDGVKYPALSQFLSEWNAITPILKEILINLNDDQLHGPDPFKMPGGEYSFLDSLTFMIDRESYCIGQIGLYRRLLGYEAMKY